MIDYTKKFTLDRVFYPSSDIEISIESDRGRILSSSSLRRLQKRTQVFALELNASIRTRLTHSLEVAQNARFIAKTILKKLKKEGHDYHLEDLDNAFVSTAEMTSLLHDIGNPPFGHFAEQIINKWIEENALPLLDELPSTSKKSKILKSLLQKDICNYDGNAQALRVITKLQRLNLSYTQILSVLKYTRGAFEEKPLKDDDFNYLRKKPGYFYSEKDTIEKIQKALHVKKGCRFPITYIMEAADDISYLSADLEDSVKKGLLSIDDVYNLIKEECEKVGEDYLLELIQKRYDQAKKNEKPYQFNMFFTLIRSSIVSDLVAHVSDVYIQNHEAIFNGEFNYALLDFDEKSKYSKAIKILEKISKIYIYQNKQIQTLELQAYAIVNGLFDIFKPLLKLNSEDFTKLIHNETIDCFISMRLLRRISQEQVVSYTNDVKKIDTKDNEEFEMMEWYFRVRLVIDYISGMTDDFALHEYKSLSAFS